MKTRATTVLCVVFVFALGSTALAQLKAGSAEDKAFTKIEQEANADAKVALLLDYEKQFPTSKALTLVYSMLEDAYQQKRDTAKVIEVGERAIKFNPDDIDALVNVSYGYMLSPGAQQMEKAGEYAQRAIDAVAKLKSQPPPPQFPDEKVWKEHLANREQYAKQILDHVKATKGN
jgi:hypothetical protein